MTAWSGPDLSADGRIASFARWICDARQRAPGSQEDEHARRLLLDLMGAAAAGRTDPAVLAVQTASAGIFAGGECPVWFSGQRLGPVGAAWVNASAASALDLDDGNRMARGHPGAAVIPAALALAGQMGCSAEDCLRALIIGYEVGLRIGAARTSYGNSGTWTAAAVAATAAAMQDCPADVTTHALAIALESAPNQLFSSAPLPRIPAPEGSHVKEGIPWSVVTGLMAVDLARAGHTGPRNLLDAQRFYDFSLQSPSDVPRITQCYIKLYACCRHIHSPLDALLGLMKQHDLRAGDLRAITVATTSGAMRISNQIAPQNLTDLQYSLPYCLALAAWDGAAAFQPVEATALAKPEVTELAQKVTLILDPVADAAFPAQTLSGVTLVTDKGTFSSGLVEPKGEASLPLSAAELREKVRVLMGQDRADPLIAQLLPETGVVPWNWLKPVLELVSK